jgi:16S rRNA (cytidine1402-2'-O)-methyltransferase
MSGIFYIVSTPIGNPEDITLRALRILREVPLIIAEDARITRQLLHHHAITTEVISYRPRRSTPETNKSQRLTTPDEVCERLRILLSSGQSAALVCDVGTPTIADPGNHLILTTISWGATLVPIPGPTAALAALVVSGLSTGRFAFDGFPPRARADRQAFFSSLQSETRTLILYETRPYLRSTLKSLTAMLGPDRTIVIARNLTTSTETLFQGSLGDAQTHFLPEPPRGEYVLILSPRAL